ncbi:DUF1275 domain-containing protein [Polynucleobacter asymbioticus]|nr:DUF1275 domain-containing protein [Polynucleobacter asymbioticus]
MPVQFLRALTSPHRSMRSDFHLGVYMAFVAGAVNAGGFLAIARYTSHMSGIVAGIGDDLALSRLLPVLGGLALLVAFVLGAMTTAIIVSWGRRQAIHSQFALPLLVEAFLLLIFGFVGDHLSFYVPLTVPAIALLLCFVMGLQNAIVTKASSAEIRTTHMTGVITDIGIELGKLLYWNKSRAANQQYFVEANRNRLKMHLALFLMFLLGGIIGAMSFKKFGFIAVVPLSLSLMIIAALQVLQDIKNIFRRLKEKKVSDDSNR